jgi:hypothetical protein
MAQQDFNYGTEATEGFDAPAQSSPGSGEEFLFEDEKKPINRNLIALVLIVVLGGGGLCVMYSRGGLGSQTPAGPAGDAEAMLWLDGAPKALGEMRRNLDETRRMVRVFDRIGNRPQVAVSDLKGNPFVRMPSLESQVAGAAAPDLTRLRKEQQIQLATEDLKGLHVQSVMAAAANSTCVINKTVLRVGQQIVSGKTEFTIERVEASRSGSRVVLSAYGQQFSKTLDKSQP